MAGGAAIDPMDLAYFDKRSGGSGVTADAIGCCRCWCHVFLDLGGMIMIVTCKVAVMTLDTRAAASSIDCSIAISVDANDSSPVDT